MPLTPVPSPKSKFLFTVKASKAFKKRIANRDKPVITVVNEKSTVM